MSVPATNELTSLRAHLPSAARHAAVGRVTGCPCMYTSRTCAHGLAEVQESTLTSQGLHQNHDASSICTVPNADHHQNAIHEHGQATPLAQRLGNGGFVTNMTPEESMSFCTSIALLCAKECSSLSKRRARAAPTSCGPLQGSGAPCDPGLGPRQMAAAAGSPSGGT